MRILLLGDTHRNARFLAVAFAAAERAGCERIIQLGDFGFGWQWLGLGENLEICKFSALASVMVERSGIELDFIDGNHENFDRLSSHPLRADGTQEVAPGVRHLPRGHRFELEGCRFLALGGATSLDRMARRRGVSWWEQEAITPAEVEACGQEPVDVLLAHDMPIECGIRADRHQSGYGLSADMDWYRNRMRVSEVLQATQPSWVFHGHLHHRYERDLRPDVDASVIGLASDRQGIDLSALVFVPGERRVELLEPAEGEHGAIVETGRSAG